MADIALKTSQIATLILEKIKFHNLTIDCLYNIKLCYVLR